MSQETASLGANGVVDAQEYPKVDTKPPRAARQYITFSFYKLNPQWRFLPEDEKQKGRDELIAVVREFQASGTVVVPYSCVGTRADTDLLLWRIDYKLERLQSMSTHLHSTGLGEIPLISSTKGMTGHPIAASAVHEAIFTMLMLENGFIAGCTNIDKMDSTTAAFPILTKSIDQKINTAMSNSFGFWWH